MATGITCACGSWPIEEYGPVCPSCVTDDPTKTLAIERYRTARQRWIDAMGREDEVFGNYFRKRASGQPTNGAALSRLMNATSEMSAELYSAQSTLYALDLDPWVYDDADGVERTPIGH